MFPIKKISNLLILNIVLINLKIVTSHKIEILGEALSEVVNNYYVQNSFRFMIINYGGNKQYFSKICEQVTEKNQENFAMKIYNVNSNSNTSIVLKESAIFFLKSNKDLQSLNQRLKMNFVDFTKFHHFIIFQEFYKNLKSFEIIENYAFYVNIIHHESFLIINKDMNVDLMAVQIFPKENNCSPRIAKINEFIKESHQWKANRFEIKFSNKFNKCRIGFGMPKSEKGKLIETIILEKILKTLENKFEYKTNFILGSNASLSMMNNRSKLVTFCPTIMPTKLQLNTVLSLYVFPFQQHEYTFLLPYGNSYSPMEKFLLPFDLATWICVITILILGCITILFVKKTNKNFKTLVFGENVRSPAFNMMIAICGQNQISLPKKFFARFILMLFILYCLVMRTGFQGVQYTIMLKVK